MALERSNVFFETIVPFTLVEDDGLIRTRPFLEASKYIVEFVDLLGTTFKPVKNDINGNITKLTKIYESDTDKFECLNDIVKSEETLDESEFHIGCDALTWLNRALIYNQLFLSNFVKDYKQVNSIESIENLSDDLTSHFTSAYELSLKKHHNWFVQKIFSVCLIAAPSRTSLLDYLGYSNAPNKNEMRDLIINSMEKYLHLLKSNTDAISILLFSHGLQP